MDVESELDDDSLVIIDSDLTNNVLSKLRRLKIQESIITASLNKSYYNQKDYTMEPSQNPDCKVYTAKLKKSVNEIKNMLEEIKYATSESNDQLKDVDIDEIKKDVLNLDGKMKSLENFMDSELLMLKRIEEELIKQINEGPKLEEKAKNKVKIQTKQYNAVVPSPIRVLINSPLKCPEVQKFQEFMATSINRCGGWNEYNHNIFVQIWNKYYAADDVVVLGKNMHEIHRNNILQQFKDEICEKIPGTKLNDVLSHSKWYSECCYLKMCQKTALDKWRDNKRKIKKRQNLKRNVISSGNSTEKLCRKPNENKYQKIKCSDKGYLGDHEFIASQSSFDICNIVTENSFQLNEDLIMSKDLQCTSSGEKVKPECILHMHNGFARPTKQWINRRRIARDQEATRPVYTSIENVDKLCIPNWRLGLKSLKE